MCITPELDGDWVEEKPPNEMNMSYFIGDEELEWYEICDNFVDEHQWKSAAIATEFDPNAFCKILANRTIAVIGDSTMRQTAKVLGSMTSVGGCGDKIKYHSADTLVGQSMGHMNRGVHWMEAVKEMKPDIVLLAVGAHIIDDDNFTIVLDAVVKDMEEIQKGYPNIQIIWKTQSPAGGYPTSIYPPAGYATPVSTKGYKSLIYAANSFIPGHPMEAGRFRSTNPMYKLYNHQSFWGRDNNILIPELQKRGIPFLDVRMLYNRADAHGWLNGDAMHFCIPGTLRIIPLLLYRLMENNFEVSKCIEMRQ